jgi:hypothetical protein
MSASIRLVAASLLCGVLASACIGSGGPTPTPPATSDAPAGSPSPSTAFACPPVPATLPAPSNRLTGVVVTPREGYDEVAFAFGPAGAGSGVPPTVELAPARPPFVAGASGLPLAVDGQSFVTLTFRDMVVADAAGTPTDAGPAAIRPSTTGVREVVRSEAFEGVVRWIVGSSAPGCVRLTADPGSSRLLLDIQHP